MSQRVKRLMKKAKQVSALEIDKLTLQKCIIQAQNGIDEANALLDQIKVQEDNLQEYINKAENSKMLMREHELFDGTSLEICVIQEDRTIIVSTLGFVAKAQAHEQDEFEFEVGYNLALQRLLNKLLEFIDNKED